MAASAVRVVTRFDLPRTPGVPTPTVAEVVATPVSAVGLHWFNPANVFNQRAGELTLWRDQLPPFKGYSGTSKGRVAAFQDGLVFVPDRFAAKLKDFALIDAVKMLPAVVEVFKQSLPVTAPGIERIEDLLDRLGEVADDAVEEVAQERARSRPYAELTRTLVEELGRGGGLVLPLVDLVEISMEVAPSPAILPRALGSTISFLVLKFEDASGRRTSLAFSTEGSSMDSIPYFPIARSHSSHTDTRLAEQETHDRIALGFARARAVAELYAFARQVPGVKKVPVAGGLADVVVPDASVAREVLGRMGATAERLSALPFVTYGLSEPLAGLRMLAAHS